MEHINYIVYEMNEVPMRLIEHYVKERSTSAIAEILRRGRKLHTISEDKGILSPWVTWPTVHRGVTNDLHMLADFGQDLEEVDKLFPSFYRLIAQNNISVGVFGSLHTYPPPQDLTNYEFYIPDTFAAGAECHPKEISAFQQFNLSMVDRSARNVSRSITISDLSTFLFKLPRLGVRFRTFGKVVKHLIAEVLNRDRRVRRRTVQAQLGFDIFHHRIKKNQPRVAGFFTNHVASAMHRYWPALFPCDYKESKFDPLWRKRFSREITAAMDEADAQIKRLKQICDKTQGACLIITSSMGQAAVDGEVTIFRQLLLEDKMKFLSFLGMNEALWSFKRSMAPRYVFQTESATEEAKFLAELSKLTINGEQIDCENYAKGVIRLKFGQENLVSDEICILKDGLRIDKSQLGLANIEIQDEAGSYAYHVPEGILLVYFPGFNCSDDLRKTVSTSMIAPMLLKSLKINTPSYMQDCGDSVFDLPLS